MTPTEVLVSIQRDVLLSTLRAARNGEAKVVVIEAQETEKSPSKATAYVEETPMLDLMGYCGAIAKTIERLRRFANTPIMAVYCHDMENGERAVIGYIK